MIPLAHHSAIAALPALVPALVVCVVVAIHFLRDRRHWSDRPEDSEAR